MTGLLLLLAGAAVAVLGVVAYFGGVSVQDRKMTFSGCGAMALGLAAAMVAIWVMAAGVQR